jgi:ribonucleoside-diphosphate reductase alpha chain
MQLSNNAQIILEQRYLKKDGAGRAIETPEDMFSRVASVVAVAEKKYASAEVAAVWEEKFKKLMVNLEFLPNSPTLLNAGRELGMMSSCFVLPVKDSLEDIYRVLAEAALIHKHGGGTAFSLAAIRPEGDKVADVSGAAGGPVKLIKAFSEAINYIRQAGVRCGCNSAALPVDHPDILKFIEAKNDANVAPNFATSVVISDDFVRKVKAGEDYDLINPRNGTATGRLNAKEVFLKTAKSAWQTGDPAVTFIDSINTSNTTPHLGRFETTDPCGGQLLLPYESSTLGTVNLARMTGGEGGNHCIDYPRLAEVVHAAVRFLDDVIDSNQYPVPAVAEASLRTRKIGLGVMGFAEMLIKIGIRYDSEQAAEVADELMGFISSEAYSASAQLARERGAFPAYAGSTFERNGGPPMRNASCLTLTNTGTTSLTPRH